MKRTLIVIGNAEPQEDQSAFIDQCDTVIRFNRTPYFDTGKTGCKTTVLCLFGIPYPKKGDEDLGLNRAVVDNSAWIWAQIELFAEPLERGYGVPRQKIEFINLANVRDLDEIQTENAKLIKRPSSGFQVLRYLAYATEYDDTEKFICGFTFEGGPLHQWEYEKKQVERYIELGLLSWVK